MLYSSCMADETTNQEILEAINTFASATEQRLTSIEQAMTRVVTKDFFDEKLISFKGDLVVMMRGEDKKVIALVELMEKKQMLTKEEAKAFYTMEPFPKFVI